MDERESKVRDGVGFSMYGDSGIIVQTGERSDMKDIEDKGVHTHKRIRVVRWIR